MAHGPTTPGPSLTKEGNREGTVRRLKDQTTPGPSLTKEGDRYLGAEAGCAVAPPPAGRKRDER